ncbi:Transcriptional regulator, TetR family [Candidatus Burkholderia pumila]|uniref:Transcriptional regulator, TetR family n=1 Tax=Candidatus Burkholderia pumila TaxID=1090375 RepID=A0ABR5HKD4_9BURK|nr:Transcriptional regulator, TetR family [Candidatus Burkholderia pumila]
MLDTTQELFYRDVIRAIGIDVVVESAGVNKMSLYRLVGAYLDRMHERYQQRFETSVASHPNDPAAQLMQALEDLVKRASATDYRGCPFLNVSCEFGDPTHPARESAARNKRYFLTRLTKISTAAGAVNPRELADSLTLLVDGIYATSQTFGPGSGPMLTAPGIARMLIDAACPPKQTQETV